MADPVPIREQIVAAALQRLTAAGIPGATVERNRRSAVDADTLTGPLLNLIEAGHTSDAVGGNDVAYEMQLILDMTVPAPTDDLVGPTLNALYARVMACLSADYTLGGLCSDVRERGFDVRILATSESAKPVAECSLDLLVAFRTTDGDPYSL